MMQTKKLIVNADDFGQSEGINCGIIQAHEYGIVTSASLMVRYPHAFHAAAYASEHPALGIGLHLDLGEWFYSDGEWKPLYEVVALDNINAVLDEIKRQLATFYKIMDTKPDHLNSHQHVHQRETIRPHLVEIANELNIPLRGCSERVNYCGDFYGQMNDGSPNHTAISVDGLKTILSRLPQGITELACHPGLFNDITTMYRIEREMEVQALCDPRTCAGIYAAGINLCSFAGIGL